MAKSKNAGFFRRFFKFFLRVPTLTILYILSLLVLNYLGIDDDQWETFRGVALIYLLFAIIYEFIVRRVTKKTAGVSIIITLLSLVVYIIATYSEWRTDMVISSKIQDSTLNPDAYRGFFDEVPTYLIVAPIALLVVTCSFFVLVFLDIISRDIGNN